MKPTTRQNKLKYISEQGYDISLTASDANIQMVWERLKKREEREQDTTGKYISPLALEAEQACITEFGERNFGQFDSKRDVSFKIKKMRELQGLSNIKMNLSINKIKVTNAN